MSYEENLVVSLGYIKPEAYTFYPFILFTVLTLHV